MLFRSLRKPAGDLVSNAVGGVSDQDGNRLLWVLGGCIRRNRCYGASSQAGELQQARATAPNSDRGHLRRSLAVPRMIADLRAKWTRPSTQFVTARLLLLTLLRPRAMSAFPPLLGVSGQQSACRLMSIRLN